MAKRKRRPAASSPDAPKQPVAEPGSVDFTLVLLVAIIVAAATVRFPLLDMPLERDEGEYAYAGQLMLDGVPPYTLAYNMKFPGTYAAFAVMMSLFGQTVTAIRIGLMLLTATTTLMVFVLARRLFGAWPACAAAATQALLSVSPPAAALWAHATHFVAFFVVAAMLLIVPASDAPSSRVRLAAGGSLLALAVLMKQPGVFFVLFALVYVAIEARRAGRSMIVDLAAFSGGGLLVAATAGALLAASGVFSRFWFWTVDYARQYVTEIPLSLGLQLLGHTVAELFGISPLLWLIAAAGIAATLFVPAIRRQRLFIIGMSVAGLLATTPGFYFREHYFIVLFPAVAIAVAAALRAVSAEYVPAIVAVLAIGWGIVTNVSALGSMDAAEVTRRALPGNPFVEMEEVGRYLREQTQPSDRIVVLGSEPELYFYAHRKSATGYIYMYPLMEKQKFASQMQREMISDIERNRPKYLVNVSSSLSWLKTDDSDETIFEWMRKDFAAGHWQLLGVVDAGDFGSESRWGAQAAAYQPRSRNIIQVYRRM